MAKNCLIELYDRTVDKAIRENLRLWPRRPEPEAKRGYIKFKVRGSRYVRSPRQLSWGLPAETLKIRGGL